MSRLTKVFKKAKLKIIPKSKPYRRFMKLQKEIFNYYNSEAKRAIKMDLPKEYLDHVIVQMEQVVKTYDNCMDAFHDLEMG